MEEVPAEAVVEPEERVQDLEKRAGEYSPVQGSTNINERPWVEEEALAELKQVLVQEFEGSWEKNEHGVAVERIYRFFWRIGEGKLTFPLGESRQERMRLFREDCVANMGK